MPRKPVPLEFVDVGAAFRKMTARRTERVNFLMTPAEKGGDPQGGQVSRPHDHGYFLRLHRRVMEAGRGARPGKRRGPT